MSTYLHSLLDGNRLKLFRRWGSRVMDGLLPRHCLMCGLPSGTANLCMPCRNDLPRSSASCRQCALPLPFSDSETCGACQLEPPPWDLAVAAMLYAFPVDRLVRRFKFQRNLACGAVLASELVLAVEEQCKQLPGVIVPVPLHRSRQFRRNFNQADILARALGKNTDIPVRHMALQRLRRTRAQSGLDADGRQKNTHGAFQLRYGESFRSVRHAALVDDVLTTGATLSECTRVLKKAGVKSVSVWVAARAPAP